MQINKIGQRATKYYFARFKHHYYWKGYVERAEMNFKIEFLSGLGRFILAKWRPLVKFKTLMEFIISEYISRNVKVCCCHYKCNVISEYLKKF